MKPATSGFSQHTDGIGGGRNPFVIIMSFGYLISSCSNGKKLHKRVERYSSLFAGDSVPWNLSAELLKKEHSELATATFWNVMRADAPGRTWETILLVKL